MFKFADVEETGYVDVATISTLAVQLLGAQLSESEKDTINNKAENKAEKGQISSFIFYLKPTLVITLKLVVTSPLLSSNVIEGGGESFYVVHDDCIIWSKFYSLIFCFVGLLSYQNFIEIMMETMQAMTHWGKLKTVLEGYVGFDTVQEQIRKKSLKRGFEFNLMVVGKLLLLF